MAHWSSGQDASLSRWKLGFDSRMGHQKKKDTSCVLFSFCHPRNRTRSRETRTKPFCFFHQRVNRGRNIAPPLPRWKPCKAEQIPVQKSRVARYPRDFESLVSDKRAYIQHAEIPYSHTAFGGILRYSSCRPTNSKFPYKNPEWLDALGIFFDIANLYQKVRLDSDKLTLR